MYVVPDTITSVRSVLCDDHLIHLVYHTGCFCIDPLFHLLKNRFWKGYLFWSVSISYLEINASARLIEGIPKFGYISTYMRDIDILHWLHMDPQSIALRP